MLPHLRALRERIHAEVCERGFNPRVRRVHAVVRQRRARRERAADPARRVPARAAIRACRARSPAIEKKLLRDGFVLRYDTEHGTDGLPGTEGAFLACSFWLADNYAFAGRIDEAEELFERLLGLRNHLGLLAEEYDPALQRQIGNFPQAFSHLALIFTAHVIESVHRGGEPRRPSAATRSPPCTDRRGDP